MTRSQFILGLGCLLLALLAGAQDANAPVSADRISFFQVPFT